MWTGIELDSIVAYRYVEKARVVVGSGDEEDTWAWDNTVNGPFPDALRQPGDREGKPVAGS